MVSLFFITCELVFLLSVWSLAVISSPDDRFGLCANHLNPATIIEHNAEHHHSMQSLVLDYMLQRRPFVFKNAISNTTLFRIAQEDRLMRMHFSGLRIEAEPHLIEDRTSDLISMNFDEFLSRYMNEELYGITDAPLAMTEKLELLPALCFLLGATTATNIIQVPVLWMSRGGTRSVIHSDSDENLLFQLAGSKKFHIASTGSYRNLYINLQPQHYSESACSPVNKDHPDLLRYPNFTHVEWQTLEVQPGDMLFLPTNIFHRVESSPERNVALNLFYKMRVHNDEERPPETDDEYRRHCFWTEAVINKAYQEVISSGCRLNEPTLHTLGDAIQMGFTPENE